MRRESVSLCCREEEGKEWMGIIKGGGGEKRPPAITSNIGGWGGRGGRLQRDKFCVMVLCGALCGTSKTLEGKNANKIYQIYIYIRYTYLRVPGRPLPSYWYKERDETRIMSVPALSQCRQHIAPMLRSCSYRS